MDAGAVDPIDPELDPAMTKLLTNNSLRDVVSLALRRASLVRPDQLKMFKGAGSPFEDGKSLLGALKLNIANQALPEDIVHWVTTSDVLSFFVADLHLPLIDGVW
jgi:hypothetical protein